MGYLKDWMKQGKYVWYITGNMSTEQATEIVEHARSCLSLKPFPIEEITDVRAIALDAGSSFVYKVPLADEKNENSCTITYYEVGPVQDNLDLRGTHRQSKAEAYQQHYDAIHRRAILQRSPNQATTWLRVLFTRDFKLRRAWEHVHGPITKEKLRVSCWCDQQVLDRHERPIPRNVR